MNQPTPIKIAVVHRSMPVAIRMSATSRCFNGFKKTSTDKLESHDICGDKYLILKMRKYIVV